MRTLIGLFVSVTLSAPAHAVDYITLSRSSPTATIAAGSLVEIAGFAGATPNQEFGGVAEFTLANGDTFQKRFSGVWSSAFTGRVATQDLLVGNKFMGIASVQLLKPATEWGVLTLKITPASEINAVTPSTVLVVPETRSGDFLVIIESSEDLVKWKPFSSHPVDSSSTTRFFRTRITKAPAPAGTP